jgi:type IV secretory pathway VirB10-like protein
MRPSLLLAIMAHLLAAALIFAPWPSWRTQEARAVEVVPIDIVIGDVTDVRALAPPAPPPEEEVAPPPEEAAAPEPLPTPDAPPPPSQTQRQPQTRPQTPLDVSDLRRRLNQNRDDQPTPPPRPDNAQDSDRTRAGAGRSQAETADLNSYFAALARTHIDREQCWTDPIGRTDGGALRVRVDVRLTRQGQIASMAQPRVTGGTATQAILDDAVRAARACAPYPFPRDPNGPPNYDLWESMTLCFGLGCSRQP